MREVLGFPPKVTKRGGAQVLYFKQSDQISDCLTYLGAPLAAMAIMEAKLEKEKSSFAEIKAGKLVKSDIDELLAKKGIV